MFERFPDELDADPKAATDRAAVVDSADTFKRGPDQPSEGSNRDIDGRLDASACIRDIDHLDGSLKTIALRGAFQPGRTARREAIHAPPLTVNRVDANHPPVLGLVAVPHDHPAAGAAALGQQSHLPLSHRLGGFQPVSTIGNIHDGAGQEVLLMLIVVPHQGDVAARNDAALSTLFPQGGSQDREVF
jgi:hypothetical protein